MKSITNELNTFIERHYEITLKWIEEARYTSDTPLA